MVDALHEAWRVLGAGGLLVDLRPQPSPDCLVELVTPGEQLLVGQLDTTGMLADDLAADRAVERVVRDGWFRPRTRGRFLIEISWSSVAEMTTDLDSSRAARRVVPSLTELARLHRRTRAACRTSVRIRSWRPLLLAVYERLARR